jgi:5-methylcytosine-specific restriction endonuclease McrA
VQCLRDVKPTQADRERARTRYAEKKAALPPKPAKPLTPRQLAKASGEITFTGKACDVCQSAVRYTSNKQCVQCTLDKQRDPVVVASKRAWAGKNKDRIRAQRAARYDPETASAKARKWAAANPERRRIISINYKARRRAHEADGDTTAVVAAWAAAAPKFCHWCDTACPDNYHIDHYVPLAKGGKHRVTNLVIACGPCNLKKNSKDPYEFANSLGRLF